MDVAHLIMDGTVGTVCSTIDSVFRKRSIVSTFKISIHLS